jgi:hypothetical protein
LEKKKIGIGERRERPVRELLEERRNFGKMKGKWV